MDYSDKITESLDTLRALEKQQTKPKYRDYVRFIRLLKEKMAATQQQAAQLLNLSLRQVQRLWQRYQQKGLMVMIQPRQATHLGKLSCTQITQLRQFLCTNQASSQADIRTFLADSFQINYTISGISELCKRLNIKHKVVRPVHARQEPGAVEAFKKNGQP